MGLKAKFNLVMLAAFVPGLGLAAALSYPFTQYSARNEVIAEAALMARQAAAISDYTDREVNPLLADQLKTRFLPQTIPFSVTQTVFRILQARYPEYSYRDPASNPTNPADRPTDWQADIIEAFHRQPGLQRLVTERDTPSGRLLSVSQPIRVNDKGCLQCHSTPAVAPASLVDLYGSENGFGWHLGDVVGAQVVTVPMRLPLQQAWDNFELFMAGLASLFLLMILIINLLLHFVVIRPVRRVSHMAGEVSLGNFDVPECETTGHDEIASLAESFNRMRRSLVSALRLLRE
jgi:HAMP domain-containing protein